jgi:hypothetical protein
MRTIQAHHSLCSRLTSATPRGGEGEQEEESRAWLASVFCLERGTEGEGEGVLWCEWCAVLSVALCAGCMPSGLRDPTGADGKKSDCPLSAVAEPAATQEEEDVGPNG